MNQWGNTFFVFSLDDYGKTTDWNSSLLDVFCLRLMHEGEFKNGKYHGKGTLYDEDGNKVYSGRWKNGDYA